LWQKKRRESEGGKNRDKKIVMVKLIILKKSEVQQQQKSSVSSAKVLELFLWCPILLLMLGILGYVGKGVTILVRQLGAQEMPEVFLTPDFFGLMCGLSQAGALRWSHQTAGL
jgi:hypothetical protein